MDGTFQLMKVLTGDNRFEETLARVENKGGRITMYDAFADAEKRGIALGKEQGIALGKEQGIALGKEQGNKVIRDKPKVTPKHLNLIIGQVCNLK